LGDDSRSEFLVVGAVVVVMLWTATDSARIFRRIRAGNGVITLEGMASDRRSVVIVGWARWFRSFVASFGGGYTTISLGSVLGLD